MRAGWTPDVSVEREGRWPVREDEPPGRAVSGRHLDVALIAAVALCFAALGAGELCGHLPLARRTGVCRLLARAP
jgi:hypothetical protein